MRFDSIHFPDELIRSIRDKDCVIFAGAGVSMGEPANLPDFGQLAEQLAAGTGDTRGEAEAIDRFLGRLQRKHIEIHQRTGEILHLEPGSHTPSIVTCSAFSARVKASKL